MTMDATSKHETDSNNTEVSRALERLLKVGCILRSVMTEEELSDLSAILNSNSLESILVTKKVTLASLDAVTDNP